eukprot:10715292-Karenia_brevis.AAC.1
MLTKCTLCAPPPGGKSHKTQRLAWTRSRLQRWLNGEIRELWCELPQYAQPRQKRMSEQKQQANKHQRCINLTREGGYSSACKALTKGAPLGHTCTVRDQLQAKHPPNTNPPNLSALGLPNTNLAPQPDAEEVERAIRSFHRLSAA